MSFFCYSLTRPIQSHGCPSMHPRQKCVDIPSALIAIICPLVLDIRLRCLQIALKWYEFFTTKAHKRYTWANEKCWCRALFMSSRWLSFHADPMNYNWCRDISTQIQRHQRRIFMQVALMKTNAWFVDTVELYSSKLLTTLKTSKVSFCLFLASLPNFSK